MPYLLIILFKINMVLLLFAATYYLVLRRLTFYKINRIFLLFGILFSSAYPFIHLTGPLSRTVPEFVPQINQNLNQLAQENSISIYWQLLYCILFAGAVLMGGRLLIQFISLRRMHNKSSSGWIGEYKVRILKDEVSPFSFWKTIYINPLLHKQQDLTAILKHESVHVTDMHTIDIILAELNMVFYWFNPGVWLIKKAVRENIEFLTDAKVLSGGTDKKTYQYSLLQAGILEPPAAIVTNFNISDLKQRIKMMNSKRSSPLMLSRYVFILPLLVLTLAFTITRKDNQKIMPGKSEALLSVPDAQPKPVSAERASTSSVKKYGSQSATPHLKVNDHRNAVILPADTANQLAGSSSSGKRIKILTRLERQDLSTAGDHFFYHADTVNGRMRKVIIRLKHPPTASQFDSLKREIETIDDEMPSSDSPRYKKRKILFLNGREIPGDEFANLRRSGQFTRVIIHNDPPSLP